MIMASNDPSLAMLYIHLLMLWASYMGCTWIESCVVVLAVLRLDLSESFCYIASCVTCLAHVCGMWSCDISTRLRYIIPIRNLIEGGGEGGGQFKTSKRILQEKMTNLKILEEFANSPDTGWEHFTGKNPDKTFLPNDQERTQSVHILRQCLEHCPLSTNGRFFIRIICTTNYRRWFSKRGTRFQKNENFLEFLGTLASFWRISDISKRILELFSGKFRKEFDVIFQGLCS